MRLLPSHFLRAAKRRELQLPATASTHGILKLDIRSMWQRSINDDPDRLGLSSVRLSINPVIKRARTK